jgi:hypothetical protein
LWLPSPHSAIHAAVIAFTAAIALRSMHGMLQIELIARAWQQHDHEYFYGYEGFMTS